MTILQLNPPIPMTCPKGLGYAWLVIDYGIEENLMWVIALNETGEIWTYPNPVVRAQKNITLDRKLENKNLVNNFFVEPLIPNCS